MNLKKLSRYLDDTKSVDLKYMSYSSEAMLQQSPVMSRLLLWIAGLFLLVMVVWASFANIDEFTRGDGKIVPSSDIQIVQNLEGGILLDLMVNEGQLVEAGQALLNIDDKTFSADFGELTLEINQLSVRAARLRAEASGTSLSDELAKLQGEQNESLISEQRQLYQARQREFRSKANALQQKITQKKQELSAAKASRENLSRSYELQLKELELNRPLVADGAVSQVEFLRLERQTNDKLGELNKVKLEIPQLESAIREAEQTAAGFAEEFAGKARAELTDVLAELQLKQENSQSLEDKVLRRIVRSPVKGMVKQLKVKTIGGVIQPGMDLVEIVPVEDSLLVDARIRPADIAFIHPGQPALVKFTAYDFSIHGGLDAEVVQISPDTIVDEEGESYYQVRLKTAGAYIGNGDQELPIIPGMVVNVDILTGQKTVLDYILKPILKMRELALRER
ncbi:HlyD family type I secretion periplasmic adaptor subunit [Porticoccus sp. W117]|uniref:HlyD family type I secretion periplasmic adaptor subunit n=1 Tax=Porticoccus sp. W117 TaxID=3054777 RepID=UPI002595F6CB|nr:HlyD family type I secretion periplasmic adaptor subunit [Porticoccus sp. W117]MDM3872605.1 HlyD family type I secretion periplasmic adaptor subunit [Porticoccus sp. W117]